MADVFISYAKTHAQLTEDLARDLEAEGFTTWWDTSLLPGDEFPEQIKNEIDAAQAVIVIWTESSVASPWVRAEANRAYARGKLITLHAAQLNLEHVPLPFNTLQSSLVTDRAKVFAALARRGVRPSGARSFEDSVEVSDTSANKRDITPAPSALPTYDQNYAYETTKARNARMRRTISIILTSVFIIFFLTTATDLSLRERLGVSPFLIILCWGLFHVGEILRDKLGLD
ncbi:MAG: toll/interleukin-1 receptor domain-containing protein [Rhodomicrobium sp.]